MISSGVRPAGHPVQQAPAAPQPSAEQIKQATTVILNEYAKAIVAGIYTVLTKEDEYCHRTGCSGASPAQITFSDGTVKVIKTRDDKLQAVYADPNIDAKINKLDDVNRAIFSVLMQRSEQLISFQASCLLICAHAKATGTIKKDFLQTAQLKDSLIFKSQVYVGLTKMTEQHKKIIRLFLKV